MSSSTPANDPSERGAGGVARHATSGIYRTTPYNAAQRRTAGSNGGTPAGGSPLFPPLRNLPPSPADSSPMHTNQTSWHPQGHAVQPDGSFFAPQGAQSVPQSCMHDDEDPLNAHYPMNTVGTIRQPPQLTPAHATSTQYAPPPLHTGGLTLSEMEGLIDRFGIDTQRSKVYAFQERNIEAKLMIMFMQQLSLDTRLSAVFNTLSQTDDRLRHLEKLCSIGWTPNKPQYKMLRALMRHYAIKALPTYTALAGYVKNNADVLQMGFYNTDPPVRTTINSICIDLAGQVKSNFRKALFKAVAKKTSLSVYAANTYNKYHLAPVPKEVPNHILATFALMRDVAEPLAKKKNSAGNDTGFWKNLEKAIDDAYKKNEPDKDRVNGPAWTEWAANLIANDKRRWPALEDSDTVIPDGTEEIDNALGITREYENDIGIPGFSADASMQDAMTHPPQDEEEPASDDEEAAAPISDALSAELARRAQGEPTM
ncbi:hypothetical protein C8T65DRAFT_738180 [Cerioporus squamosus]|nr:hypothetical protein C8T65DRAFT_738180 [Cerioporus squamosus]